MLVVISSILRENRARSASDYHEQISSVGLFAVTEYQRTEDEHDDRRTRTFQISETGIN